MENLEHELVISDKKRVTVLRVIEEVHDVCSSCGCDLCHSPSHYCEEEERVLERTALVV